MSEMNDKIWQFRLPVFSAEVETPQFSTTKSANFKTHSAVIGCCVRFCWQCNSLWM